MAKGFEVIWLPEALGDLVRFREFLGPQNLQDARRAAKSIQETIKLLQKMPEIGKPILDGTERRELYSDFGSSIYVIRYIFDGTAIHIVRLWHGREMRDE